MVMFWLMKRTMNLMLPHILVELHRGKNLEYPSYDESPIIFFSSVLSCQQIVEKLQSTIPSNFTL